MGGFGLCSSGLGLEPVTSCCEHGSKPSGNFYTSKRILDSQGLCSMELVTLISVNEKRMGNMRSAYKPSVRIPAVTSGGLV